MAHFNQHLHTLDTILYQIRYRDPQRIRAEVADIFMKPHVAALVPQSRQLVRNGPPQQLLCLVGTIPIMYNGNTYNIPINLWVVDSYPYAPPVIYVTPTNDMAITPRHKHVDLSGMVYHPYLSSWNMATCNLVGLISNLSSVFSAEPPVRSQSRNAQTPSTTASSVQTPSNTASSYTPSPSYNNVYNAPTGNPTPTPNPSLNSSYYNPSTAKPAASTPNPSYYNPSQPNGLTSSSAQPPPPYQHPPEYTPPKPEDPAIVEKRNAVAKVTEKLMAQVKAFHQTTSQEIEKFSKEKRDSEEVGSHFDMEKARLQQELEQAEQETKALTDKLDELTKWLETNETNTEPDIDVATDPKDPLTKQLLGLVATDATMNDIFFYLDKGFAGDKITPEVYLKIIRSQSRDQFMVRALMRKIEASQRQQSILQHHQQPPPITSTGLPQFSLNSQRV